SSATVAPAPAPTGPPISTPGCVFCAHGRSSGARWFGRRSSARSLLPLRSAALAVTVPGPSAFRTAVSQLRALQHVHPVGSLSGRLRPPARRPLHQSGLPVCSGYSPQLGPASRESPCALAASQRRTCLAVWRQTPSTLPSARSRPDHEVVPPGQMHV